VNARLERKLRTLAAIIVAGTAAVLAINLMQGRTSLSVMIVGTVFGLLMSTSIGSVELFVLDGPMRNWLGNLSFTANLIVRSAVYAVIITLIQSLQSGEIIGGLLGDTSSQDFWLGFTYSALVSVASDRDAGHSACLAPQAGQAALNLPGQPRPSTDRRGGA